ncbi:MAG: type IV secretory system conjugative DNA transfer family protein [Paracoccus sp. (in: a-proteobacteria)]
MSRVIGRLFRFLAGSAAIVITMPWLLFQLAVLLLLASGAAIVTFMLVRGLILGEAVVTDPTSVAGRLGFLVVQLAFWALAVRVWTYLYGFDPLFARRGNSHGSARFSSKAERAAFRRGDGLLIGRDPETGRLLRHDGPAHLLTLAPHPGRQGRRHSRWLRLMVSQALQDIARAAERPGEVHSAADTPAGTLNGPGSATEGLEGREAAQEAGEPPERRTDAARPVSAPALFLLDEFDAFGRLEAVERGMGLMAGYGIQLWPILQDLSQLRDLYGARAGTFLANAAVQQVFGVNDLDTAKWLSESIGRETAYGQSESHQPGEPASLTTAPLARDLLTPDEIMQMPAHLQLLRVQGQPVMLSEKLHYYADPEFRDLFTPHPT